MLDFSALPIATMPSESPDVRPSPPAREGFHPAKGNEVLGIVQVTLGLLLVVSLGSYHPADPSFLHDPGPAGSGDLHNLIGVVGAQLAALSFGLLGAPALLLPVLLLTTGWKRLRRHEASRVVGRGAGAVLLLATLPGLLQLNLGSISWKGVAVDAGGAFGRILSEFLEHRVNYTGALLVLLAAVVIGATLLVQSTLGDRVDKNDVPFRPTFPYLGFPHSGGNPWKLNPNPPQGD